MDICIATATNRKATNWKNETITWDALVVRLKKCKRTEETVAEYKAMTKDRQAEVKDVGGFVGGVLDGPRRRKVAVRSRSIITLDIDYAPQDLWVQLELEYSCKMAMYTTHSHTPERPRLRLLIQLDRLVSVDEYDAISRRVAADIGLDYFDPSTFQVERLMYWPSAPRDGEYLIESQDGDELVADEVLAQYTNWLDVTERPGYEQAEARAAAEVAKLGDPGQKDGVIGAFCRAFSMAEVLDQFLADVYEPGQGGKYSYTKGSGVNGLYLYPDGWHAFSHHSTDPAGAGTRHARNAFDLVRLHKFGHLDENAKEGTPSHKLPSFKEMTAWAVEQNSVKIEMDAARFKGAVKAFEKVGTVTECRAILIRDKKGNILQSAENIKTILEVDPDLAGKFAYNEFSIRNMILGPIPWAPKNKEREYKNKDNKRLRQYIELHYGIVSPLKIADAIDGVCEDNSYHPVKDYLATLKWDGVERLDTMLTYYFDAENTELNRAFSRKTMVAAIARIMEPGIKFDHVLVLAGEGGKGKSFFINKLAGDWFSDDVGDIENKTSIESLQGVWLMEVGELAKFNKKEDEDVKKYITRRIDKCRPAYGQIREDFPRQCIFIGTSNNTEFLKDPTGNRRFWPVVAIPNNKRVFGMTQGEVDQLWAEALVYYQAGEKLYLDERLEEMAQNKQAQHTEINSTAELINTYLEKERLDVVTAADIWEHCFFGARERLLTGAVGRKICQAILSLKNWERSDKKERYKGGNVTWVYKRKPLKSNT